MATYKPVKKCSVLKCKNPASIKGFCDKHYRRQRVTGFVHLKPKIIKSFIRTKNGIEEKEILIPKG